MQTTAKSDCRWEREEKDAAGGVGSGGCFVGQEGGAGNGAAVVSKREVERAQIGARGGRGRHVGGCVGRRVWRKARWGTYRPMTTMQTVSGVERMRPGHPQRSAQKMAMARRAREEMPVRELKSQGSTKLVAVSSRVRKGARIRSGWAQEEKMAMETMRGRMRLVAVPT